MKNPAPKRVILTGANGFVGRQIAKALVARGHSVTGIVRRTSGLVDGVQAVETTDLFAKDRAWWANHLAGADALIHAAWFVQPGEYLHSPENLRCLNGSLVLGEAARAAGLPHFIGIGTCMEYRLPSDRLDVDAPTGPTTPYAAAKLELYCRLRQRFARSRTRFSWARLFYLHGEAEQATRLVPYITRQLAQDQVARLSAGDQLRDFMDVADAGRLIAGIVDTGQTGAINVCSGQPVTVRRLAEQIADRVGKRHLLAFGSAERHPFDPLAVVGICNAQSLAVSGAPR